MCTELNGLTSESTICLGFKCLIFPFHVILQYQLNSVVLSLSDVVTHPAPEYFLSLFNLCLTCFYFWVEEFLVESLTWTLRPEDKICHISTKLAGDDTVQPDTT